MFSEWGSRVCQWGVYFKKTSAHCFEYINFYHPIFCVPTFWLETHIVVGDSEIYSRIGLFHMFFSHNHLIRKPEDFIFTFARKYMAKPYISSSNPFSGVCRFLSTYKFAVSLWKRKRSLILNWKSSGNIQHVARQESLKTRKWAYSCFVAHYLYIYIFCFIQLDFLLQKQSCTEWIRANWYWMVLSGIERRSNQT